jgi:sugar phosphate permease
MGAADKNSKVVAPDGGWGWVVVIGVMVVNFATRSIEPSFGLLFGDKLRGLGVATTGASAIMSTLDATINFSGLFVGPLIREYSYRKVALVGSALSAIGLIATFPAGSMAHIISTYSILGGLGVGFAWSSTFVALNHYFTKKRGQAVGLSMVGTGLGMLAMPQAVQLLLEAYSFSGAVLILGGAALHSIVGSMLLQPVKWHLKTEKHLNIEHNKEHENKGNICEAQSPLLEKNNIAALTASAPSGIEKQESIGKRPSQNLLRIVSTASMMSHRRKMSVISSISSLDFTGSTGNVHMHVVSDDEDDHVGGLVMKKPSKKRMSAVRNYAKKTLPTSETRKVKDESKLSTHPSHNSYWKRVVHFMDLDLLKDPIYLNILFGLSVFYVAEVNFKMVVPFFLHDLGYTKQDIAFFLSMTAVSDIVARAVLPPICDRLKITRRLIFVIAAIFLGLSRSVLAEQTEYAALMATLVINGLFRGATLINFTLTISEYCSLDKLPAAFGLHMVAKGLFIAALGPLIGVIRDVSGSYPLCIHSQSLLIFICIAAWAIEYLVTRRSSNTKQDNTENIDNT